MSEDTKNQFRVPTNLELKFGRAGAAFCFYNDLGERALASGGSSSSAWEILRTFINVITVPFAFSPSTFCIIPRLSSKKKDG